MAPALTSFETETTINVSQGFRSSSAGPPEVIEDSVQQPHRKDAAGLPEIIEDSVPEAYRGGAVKPPDRALPDDEDDLYSESPQGKASRERRTTSAATNTSRQRNASIDAHTDLTGSAAPRAKNVVKKQQNGNAVGGLVGAVDMLIAKGATVHNHVTLSRTEAASRPGVKYMRGTNHSIPLKHPLISGQMK